MMHPKNKVEPVSDSVSGKTQLVPNGNPEIKTDAASRTTTPLAFSDVAERVHSDRRLERNTVVWKDTNGHIFTTLSSESNIEVECSDVLDGFNFDRPELILRILGNAEHNTTSYDYREIPELEYCVSYTGKGGVHLLPVPLRRRLIQLVHEIGAWIVSEYEGKDILESTNQPYVMPDQLKPKFSPESSIWPPTLGYSSVYLANAPRSHELKPKLQSSNDPFECVLLANGNVHSLERMLSTLDFSKANILVIKGSGGLADALANSVSGETSNFSLDTVLSALGIRWSPHKTYTDCYVVEDDVEMSDDDFEMFEDDSNVTGSKATIYHQEKFTINDEGQTTLNTTILENLYDGQNHLTVSKGMGAPRVTFPQDFVGPSYAQNSVRSEMVISVKNFEKLCAKVTIFEADLTLPDYGLGKAILQCVLRGQPERNIKLLRLCLDLDCFGEAETYIFPKGYQSIDPSPIVQTAFMKKRLKFLEYFLRTGVFDALQDDEYAMNSIVTDSRALSFIDKTLWHEKKVNHKDFFSINDHLFRQCLMSKNFDMIDISQLFWFKTKDPLGTLLLANIYLTKVAKKEKNHLKRAQIKATAIEYQGLAVSFVNACFDKDPETTIKMITHKMDQFDEKSCIDLAMESSNLDFLVQPACITVQRRVWRWGNLYDFYKENEDVSKTLFSPSTASKREKIGHKTLWRRYYMLLCVPKTMFTLNGLGLIIFIYMFGLTLLGRLEQYKFHWLEAVLLSNVMVGLCEEIYEGRIIGKEAYFKSGWNIADLASIALFLASAGCRIVSYFFTGNFLFEVSRVSLALDFIIFTLRLLHNCYSSPELGPTCAMMIKTIKLLTRYLYLLLLVWASYAIASESVLYPNSVLSFYTFYYLFRKAYWQMFGELFLDELEAGKASDPNALECTNNVSLYATYQMLRCPSTFGRYVAPVLLAVYIMFTYVLLFSLITASFTKSIEKIQQKAYKLWRFQFFELTRSFSKVMFLPLPFTVISIGAVVCDEERRDEDGFSISDSRIKKVLQQIKETKKKLYDRLPTSKLNGSLQDSDMACCLAGISNKFKVIKKCVKHPHKENSSEERDSAFSDLKEMIYNYGTYLKKTELIKGLEETVDRIEEPNSPVDETHISNLKTFITEYGSSVSKHLHRANTHKRTELKLKYTFTEIKVLESDFPAVQPIVSNLRVNISCIERLHFIEEMKKCIFEIEKQNTIDTKGNQIQKQLMKKWNPIAGKDNKIHILFKELLDLSEKLEELNLGASRNDSVKQERTTLREIRRRLLDLQKALYKIPISSQSRLEVKDMLGSSTREKIRGLLTAINYYWQISCDCKMLQPLDDLEKLMLQNPFDDEYCQMRAKIKDLESFILQSHIEPMLQMKRNSSKPDSVKEKTIETSTNISPITEYGHKVAPRVPGKTESARPQNAAEDDIGKS
ncbi:unnamed protein product [Lymnaea stagnalis]|uniref:Uncharacterized protein n=1 Tax=Lymnaea stagnalis TaxID=6523 RepID=A0AAV2HMU6_LYMST